MLGQILIILGHNDVRLKYRRYGNVLCEQVSFGYWATIGPRIGHIVQRFRAQMGLWIGRIEDIIGHIHIPVVEVGT